MLDEALRRQLLEVAESSIRHGLEQGRALALVATDYPPLLQAERATFVTLHRGGELRGCIGSLEAHRPLVVDVAENAYAAAFSDPRFPPLSRAELAGLELHISILSPAEPMQFDSETDLVAQLQPGVDGLVMREGPRRGTFLPSVWESLPRPEDFLTHLKLKAGLPADYWSESLEVARYRTESFGATLPLSP